MYISLHVWHQQEELSKLISWEATCKARRNHHPGWSIDKMNSNLQKLFPPENSDQGLLFCLPTQEPLLTTLLHVLVASAAAAGLQVHLHIWQGGTRRTQLSVHVRWAVCTQGRSATSAPSCLPKPGLVSPLKASCLILLHSMQTKYQKKGC